MVARAPRPEARGTEEVNRIRQVLPRARDVKGFMLISGRVRMNAPDRIPSTIEAKTLSVIGNLGIPVVMDTDTFADITGPSGARSTQGAAYHPREAVARAGVAAARDADAGSLKDVAGGAYK